MKGSEESLSRTVPRLSGSYRSSGSWESPDSTTSSSSSPGGDAGAAVASFGFSDARYTDVRKFSAATRLDSIGEDEVFESHPHKVFAVESSISSKLAARYVLNNCKSQSRDCSRNSSSGGSADRCNSSECASPNSNSPPDDSVSAFDDGVYKVVNPSHYLLTGISAESGANLADSAPVYGAGARSPAPEGAVSEPAAPPQHFCVGYSVIESSVCDTTTPPSVPSVFSVAGYSGSGNQIQTPGYSVVGQLNVSQGKLRPADHASDNITASGFNSSNNNVSVTASRGPSSGYATASSNLSGIHENPSGGTLGKELDLELVRLEILVDSLQEMEEQLNLSEQQEDSMSEYQSSEDGDLSSAREVGTGPGGLGLVDIGLAGCCVVCYCCSRGVP